MFNHGPFPRTDEELSKCIDFTTQIVRTEPPYAWTGCYGDLTFPLANEYNEADMMTIEVSCYPGVTVSYEFSSLDHDGLRVIEAGEVVFSVPEVWYVEFLDLNKDNFPELLVECSGINDGYEYTFHKEVDEQQEKKNKASKKYFKRSNHGHQPYWNSYRGRGRYYRGRGRGRGFGRGGHFRQQYQQPQNQSNLNLWNSQSQQFGRGWNK